MITDLQHRNTFLLAGAQALYQTAMIVMVTVGGLVGLALAPDPRLSTLPLAAVMLAGTISMVPAALMMQRYGRRAGFLFGCSVGVVGACLAVVAVLQQDFWVFLGANALLGTYSSFAGYYRFAAADAATPSFRSQALSWVVAGGVVAALAGPAIVRFSADWGSQPYVAPFAASILIGLMAIVVVSRIRVPPMNVVPLGATDAARPFSAVLRQRVFLTAVAATTCGFAVMVMVMTATPLAMQMCGLPLTASASVIQWHMLGMFVPSFFTGKLIQRWGVLRVMSMGVILLGSQILIALAGTSYANFAVALVLVGVGWNFLFVGGSVLLTESYRPHERARTQATHDVFMYAVASIASLSAGGLLASLGWRAVNLASIPALILVAVAIFGLARERSRAAA